MCGCGCARGLEPGRGRSFDRSEESEKKYKKWAKMLMFYAIPWSRFQSPGPESLLRNWRAILACLFARVFSLFFWRSDLSAKSSCHWSSFYSKFLGLFSVLARAKSRWRWWYGEEARNLLNKLAYDAGTKPSEVLCMCCCFLFLVCFRYASLLSMVGRYRRLSHTFYPFLLKTLARGDSLDRWMSSYHISLQKI